MVKSILTLDTGTCTGFCNWKLGHKPTYGHVDLKSYRHDEGELQYRFDKFLRKNITENGVDFICFEEPILITKGKRTDTVKKAKRLLGLVTTVERLSFEAGARRSCVPVGEWRRAIHGNGRLSTEEAKTKAFQFCKYIGYEPSIHDEAEAICIMDYTAGILRLNRQWQDSRTFHFKEKARI